MNAEWTLIDWAEHNARENLKARLAAIDHLASQANGLLHLLLVGMGGALAYGVKVFDTGPAGPLVWGSAALCAWLAWIAVVLMINCITTQEQPVAYNSGKNLYQPELLTQYSTDQLRAFELENIDRRIDSAKQLNGRIAGWLDRCRYATVASPLVFSAAAALVLVD
ncbi:MAG: hypothetical protein Q7V09_15090 [Hydrogenophaga sp.]|uniref:hypothetical protein n=1 Tax=Hydrogenophaga sp. TaxID=1904254 RepID=UPI00271EC45B|nr:hypothetical protein [Hydrogenophaga sp.]MDO9031757.1 hypothetical protein [Hydrogenophaga sp.]